MQNVVWSPHYCSFFRKTYLLNLMIMSEFRPKARKWNCEAPSYLSDDCQPVSDSRPRRLRSSDSLSCVVRRAHNTYGDRCFATAGRGSGTLCRLNCNNVALSDNLNGVWRLFCSDRGTTALCDSVKQRRIEIVLLTYLLMCSINLTQISP